LLDYAIQQETACRDKPDKLLRRGAAD